MDPNAPPEETVVSQILRLRGVQSLVMVTALSNLYDIKTLTLATGSLAVLAKQNPLVPKLLLDVDFTQLTVPILEIAGIDNPALAENITAITYLVSSCFLPDSGYRVGNIPPINEEGIGGGAQPIIDTVKAFYKIFPQIAKFGFGALNAIVKSRDCLPQYLNDPDVIQTYGDII